MIPFKRTLHFIYLMQEKLSRQARTKILISSIVVLLFYIVTDLIEGTSKNPT